MEDSGCLSLVVIICFLVVCLLVSPIVILLGSITWAIMTTVF